MYIKQDFDGSLHAAADSSGSADGDGALTFDRIVV
jgi:hypothetical protein